MDVISRMVGSVATVPVTKTHREEAAEQRNAFAREVDSNDNRGNLPPVQGMQGRINTENNVSETFTYLNNGTDLYGTGAPENGLSWGSGLFDGGGTAESTAATARANIEARAESLTTEMAFDRARGFDVSDSLVAMSNLSGNLEVLDSNTATVNFNEIASELPAVASVPPEAGEPTTVADEIVAAAAEQSHDEMSIAAQIASQAKADHAASIDIMNDDDGGATSRANAILT
jgi:hypothetical protein